MTAHPRRRIRKRDVSSRAPMVSKESTLLVVGEALRDPEILARWNAADGTVAVAYQDFCVETLEEINPDIVVTSLVSYSFDCTDVARTLVDAEYPGKLRVLCNPLPKPELVSEELRITFPSLDIDLWIVPMP